MGSSEIHTAVPQLKKAIALRDALVAVINGIAWLAFIVYCRPSGLGILLTVPITFLLLSIVLLWSAVRRLSVRIEEEGMSMLGLLGRRRYIAWANVNTVTRSRSLPARLLLGGRVCVGTPHHRICLREEDFRSLEQLLRFIQQRIPPDLLTSNLSARD